MKKDTKSGKKIHIRWLEPWFIPRAVNSLFLHVLDNCAAHVLNLELL